MKNRFLLLLIASFQMYNIFGQNPICIPDLKYKDSTAGIYPRPYNDSTKLGGINRAACIDEDFLFPLTVIIPDMIVVPLIGALALESAKLDTANSVQGLPKGIRYFCNPGDCNMAKNKPGCVVLKGKATSENKTGRYDLVINLKLVTALGTLDVAFPGAFFPGKYFIDVATKGSNACLTSDIQASRIFQGQIKAYPIPTKENLNLNIMAVQSGIANLRIIDVAGRNIQTYKINLYAGENNIAIPTNDMHNGTYFYTVDQGGLSATKKFMVYKD